MCGIGVMTTGTTVTIPRIKTEIITLTRSMTTTRLTSLEYGVHKLIEEEEGAEVEVEAPIEGEVVTTHIRVTIDSQKTRSRKSGGANCCG